jgi:hypothetical protein
MIFSLYIRRIDDEVYIPANQEPKNAEGIAELQP